MAQTFAIDLRHPPLVLAGTSLGPESDAVVRAALRLARAGRGRVYLAHALEPPPVPGGAMGFALVEPQLAARARATLLEQLDRVGASTGEIAGFEADVGQAGAVLCAAAERLNADVVVVAAVAASPPLLHRVGSTVHHLLREGSRPVLVVKGEPRIPPARVLAALDLSPLAGDSLRCGLALLCGTTSGEPPELVAVHAVDESHGEPVERPREALASFIEEHTADYAGPIRSEVRQGDAVAEILAAGEREQPDLVLLGTHGRSGWQRLRLGSVAEAVLHHAPTSVLVVPPSAAFGSGIAEAVGGWVRATP
jgi:nucleotide-binding universal stress UspA family protein